MLSCTLVLALILGGGPHPVVSTVGAAPVTAIEQERHKIFAGLTDAGVGLQFDYLDEADMVALVRPSGPAQHFALHKYQIYDQYYVVQPVTVIESPDCASGTELHVYYAIYRDMDAGKTVHWPASLSEISEEDTALEDRTYLIVAKQQGAQVEVVSTDFNGRGFSGFTVDVVDTEVLNVTTGNAFIEADGVTWAQHEDRREWVLHTLLQSLQHMPESGFRTASWLLESVNWIQRPKDERVARSRFSGYKDRLYKAARQIAPTLLLGRSARERLYMQGVLIAQQGNSSRSRRNPESAKVTPILYDIVRNGEPFDDMDMIRFRTMDVRISSSDSPQLLNVADNTAHAPLAEWAISRILRLPEVSDQALYFRLAQNRRVAGRAASYNRLITWRNIQGLTVRTTRDNRGRLVSIDNEAEVRAAIEASFRP